MCTRELWDHCHWGTKRLVDEYVSCVGRSLSWVPAPPQPQLNAVASGGERVLDTVS